MDYNSNLVAPGYKSNFIQIITMVSFVLFCHFLFNNYALGGNIGWVIVPLLFMIVMMAINLKTSTSTVNISLTISMILVSISLFLSAYKIKNQKSNEKGKNLVHQTEMKYLVSTIMFSLVVIFTMSPLGNWIAGDNQNSMYSKNFIFIYGIISYALYIMYDTIRHYNLFNLNNLIFGEMSTSNNSNYGIIVSLCIWFLYSLLVFEGIQFVGASTTFDSRHFITISILTLVLIIFTFIYYQRSINDCDKWKSTDNKNNLQEIYVNIISSTIVLLLLTIIGRNSSF